MTKCLTKLIAAANGEVDSAWLAESGLSARALQFAAIELLGWIQRRARLRKAVDLQLTHPATTRDALCRAVIAIADLSDIVAVTDDRIGFRPALHSEEVRQIEEYVTSNFVSDVEV